jgi:hypothetical protein
MLWAGPPKDTVNVLAGTDTTGFTPNQNGAGEWTYASSIPAGQAVADSIPVQFTLQDTNNTSGDGPYAVSLNAVGQIASAISFDTSSFTMVDGNVVTHWVYINTASLVAGDYTANVQVQATPQSSVAVSHGTLHLHIHVVDPGDPPACYISDSAGLKLLDCGGQAVATGGEYLIVTNAKKVITATNPGQFYYNLVWQNNTGSDVTFTSLGLSGTNVVPAGANSVHVLIYNGSQFTSSFDDVNTNGTPCGQSGTTCKAPITVPAGQTMWLTWHVAYMWTGSTLWGDIPSLLACSAQSLHGTISMSAFLTNADQSVTVGCGGTANGYKGQ